MPTMTVRELLAADLGPDWADRLVELDPMPAAAASIGQVHRGRWHDGREVAVKVQYPGAADALRSDLRQIGRLARGLGPIVPGLDLKPLVAELQARAIEELDYRLEADAQRAFAAAYAEDPSVDVPGVVAGGDKVLITEWLDSSGSLATVIRDGTKAERDRYGELFAEFLFSAPARTGMLHADPHPGNFRTLPSMNGTPARLGVLDFGAVARLPGGTMPRTVGAILRIASIDDYGTLVDTLREEGMIRDRITVDPDQLRSYLSPFLEPAAAETFTFSRAWMREQFRRVNDPRGDAHSVMLRLNLPPEYLLIHRAWTGGIGVLSQLGATVPFRRLLEENLPGFAEA
jgi:predicted unusual protein kinase regulating ubiquinone biosynthesis (AarF/ABC1/UbiB family)